MNWMINLTMLLLITTLTGSLAQIIWFLAKWILERSGYLQWCYKGLWIVAFFYLVPFAYIGMVFAKNMFSGGVLFQPTPRLIDVCRIFIVLWILGLIAMVFPLIRDVMAVRRQQNNSFSCKQWEQELFVSVCKSLKISGKKVRLCRNREVSVPLFGGILQPMVFLPEMEITKEQLHIVLLHELTHYKQRVSWLMMAARVVKVVQWFNPFAWMLEGVVDRWGEFDSDAKNCIRMGGMKKYFGVIISILEKASESEGTMASYLTKSNCEIIERMQHMNKFGKRKKKPLGIMILLATFFMGTYSLTVVAATKGAGDLYQQCYFSCK